MGLDLLRWSTHPLVFFSLLLNHEIYLKLSKFTKWQLWRKSFWVSFCEFAQLYITVFSFSAWDKPCDPEGPTGENYRTCRPPYRISWHIKFAKLKPLWNTQPSIWNLLANIPSRHYVKSFIVLCSRTIGLTFSRLSWSKEWSADGAICLKIPPSIWVFREIWRKWRDPNVYNQYEMHKNLK